MSSLLMGSYFRLRVHTAKILVYVCVCVCVYGQGDFSCLMKSVLTWWTWRTLELDCLDLHLDTPLPSC